MCSNKQTGNAVNKVYSASDCTCSTEVKSVLFGSGFDVDVCYIDEPVECQACIDTLIVDTVDKQHLGHGMAYEYLLSKYSIKCSYKKEEAELDLPF